MKQPNKRIIGVDAGSESSGIIILVENQIKAAHNLPNNEVVEFIYDQRSSINSPVCELIVIIEDVRPYNMRISDGIIKTIKFLGQLEWRLTNLNINFVLIPRWEVKQWVFLQFKALAWPMIEQIIVRSQKRAEKKGLVPRNASPKFIYVEDRIIERAMRKHWSIDKATPGQKAAYGLKTHSWQALGLVSYYLALK